MSFANGAGWPAWQRAYRYGLLLIELPPQLASVLDPIRLRLDPVSAARFGAHVTLTPPFAVEPNAADEERIGSAVRSVAPMSLQLGRPTRFIESSVTYLPVMPRQGVDELRAVLLDTGLFRLDLPHTNDFVPHLTVSEFGTATITTAGAEVPDPEATLFRAEEVAWVAPDEAFHFTVRRTFPLGVEP